MKCHVWELFHLIFVKPQLRTRLIGGRERRKEFKVPALDTSPEGADLG